MQKLNKSIEVDLSTEQAFNAFINELTLWWPKAYTWSKDKLMEISINAIPGGHCTEMGPNDFRCDWGTVSQVTYGDHISIKWQISALRVPEPDPDKASEVQIYFRKVNDKRTRIELKHDKFKNHGSGYEEYREAMDAEQGWDYILTCFAIYSHIASQSTAEVKS